MGSNSLHFLKYSSQKLLHSSRKFCVLEVAASVARILWQTDQCLLRKGRTLSSRLASILCELSVDRREKVCCPILTRCDQTLDCCNQDLRDLSKVMFKSKSTKIASQISVLVIHFKVITNLIRGDARRWGDQHYHFLIWKTSIIILSIKTVLFFQRLNQEKVILIWR